MSEFLDNARQIFDAAESSACVDHAPADYTILLGSPKGGIQMIANSDWSLGEIQRERGAKLAYRVTHARGKIVVDGQDGNRQCHLEAETPSRVAQFLLNTTPAWDGQMALPSLTAGDVETSLLELSAKWDYDSSYR